MTTIGVIKGDTRSLDYSSYRFYFWGQMLTSPFGAEGIWEFPKIRGTILGVPILRIIVYWGLYWGPPILGNYHIITYIPLIRHVGHTGPFVSLWNTV